MAQAAQASRENRTITVDFNDETTYRVPPIVKTVLREN
jgi:hypothetical protein